MSLIVTQEFCMFNQKTGIVSVQFSCINESDSARLLAQDLFFPYEITANQFTGIAAIAVDCPSQKGYKLFVPSPEKWGIAVMNTSQAEPVVLGGAFSAPFQMGESGSGKMRFSMNAVQSWKAPYQGRGKVRLGFMLPPQSKFDIQMFADLIKN